MPRRSRNLAAMRPHTCRKTKRSVHENCGACKRFSAGTGPLPQKSRSGIGNFFLLPLWEDSTFPEPAHCPDEPPVAPVMKNTHRQLSRSTIAQSKAGLIVGAEDQIQH